MADEAVPKTPVGVEIGLLREEERAPLFQLLAGVVERYEGFPQLPPLSPDGFEGAFLARTSAVVAARGAGGLLGAYYLRPNGPGRASHVANAGYVVDPAHRRRGVGRALVADSIVRAGQLGFAAVQFNLVFASNPARRLYEELGFAVVGRIPGGVAPAGGEPGEDALIYWRAVVPAGHGGTAASGLVRTRGHDDGAPAGAEATRRACGG